MMRSFLGYEDLNSIPIDALTIRETNASLMTLFSGVFCIVFGFLQVGSIIRFISSAVITGFISASAIIVLAEQAPVLLGISLKNSTIFWSQIYLVSHSLRKLSGFGLR